MKPVQICKRPVFFGMYGDTISELTFYLIETPFNAFANRADPDQAALVRADWSGSTLFAYGNITLASGPDK